MKKSVSIHNFVSHYRALLIIVHEIQVHRRYLLSVLNCKPTNNVAAWSAWFSDMRKMQPTISNTLELVSIRRLLKGLHLVAMSMNTTSIPTCCCTWRHHLARMKGLIFCVTYPDLFSNCALPILDYSAPVDNPSWTLLQLCLISGKDTVDLIFIFKLESLPEPMYHLQISMSCSNHCEFWGSCRSCLMEVH